MLLITFCDVVVVDVYDVVGSDNAAAEVGAGCNDETVVDDVAVTLISL